MDEHRTIIEALARERGYTVEFRGDGLLDLMDAASGMTWHDALPEDVINFLKHPLWAYAETAVWGGLNLERFDVIGCLKSRKGGSRHRDAVLLMKSRDINDSAPWCAEYRGSGRYFSRFNDLADYVISRFG